MQDIIKILFICHGNICRSPMAEFIMKDLCGKRGVSELFEIASAAVSSEETGNPVYPPARRILAEHGISCAGKTARRMNENDCDYYDLLIGMDDSNIRRIKKIAGEKNSGKVHYLMEYAGENRSVSDPWYSGDFDTAWNDILKGTSALLEFLLAGRDKMISAPWEDRG